MVKIRHVTHNSLRTSRWQVNGWSQQEQENFQPGKLLCEMGSEDLQGQKSQVLEAAE